MSLVTDLRGPPGAEPRPHRRLLPQPSVKCDASGDIDVVLSEFLMLQTCHGGARTGVGK